MARRNVVCGQRVRRRKQEAAKRLRAHMTPAEKLLWDELRRLRSRGLHFRRQQIIHGFIVDFYSNVAGLVIEVDGDVHQGQEDYDRGRDQVLLARDLTILRFANREIFHDLERVMAEIFRTVANPQEFDPLLPPSPERGGVGGGVQ